MTPGSVPVKTPEGQAELVTRRLRMSQRHRTVLLLVDGRRTESEVRVLATQAGVPESCFDELLGLALIALPTPVLVVTAAFAPETSPSFPAASSTDELLPDPAPNDTEAGARFATPDSLLPASGTLPPESSRIDSRSGGRPPPDSWLPSETDEDVAEPADVAFDMAREMLVRAVRNEAPLAGSLTLLRLRRARSRADLNELLDEVEARINKRHRSLAALQTLTSVRQLLRRQSDAPASRT